MWLYHLVFSIHIILEVSINITSYCRYSRSLLFGSFWLIVSLYPTPRARCYIVLRLGARPKPRNIASCLNCLVVPRTCLGLFGYFMLNPPCFVYTIDIITGYQTRIFYGGIWFVFYYYVSMWNSRALFAEQQSVFPLYVPFHSTFATIY